MKRFRKVILWVHLAIGLVFGAVIAVMAFTGAMLVFAPQVFEWADREVSRVAIPEEPVFLTLSSMISKARAEVGGASPVSVKISNETSAAVLINFGRSGSVYVNPYTGEVLFGNSRKLMPFFRGMAFWHRRLGIRRGRFGFSLVQVSTLGLGVLCLSGLFLWWPRSLRWRAIKTAFVPKFRARGRTLHWSWHNVAGIWFLPFLIAMTWSGLVISFKGLGQWLYTPPIPQEDFSGTGRDLVSVTPDACFDKAREIVPEWDSISMHFFGGKKKRHSKPVLKGPPAVVVEVEETGHWHPLPVEIRLHPFTGELLFVRRLSDMGFGEIAYRANMSIHRGNILGVFGQVMNFSACMALIVLIVTGYVLSWRRSFGPSKRVIPQAIERSVDE